jgi:hypothetical protein
LEPTAHTVLQLDQATLCLRLQMLVVAQMALIFRESARSAHLKLVVALLARGAAAAHLAQRARQAGSRLLQDRAHIAGQPSGAVAGTSLGLVLA